MLLHAVEPLFLSFSQSAQQSARAFARLLHWNVGILVVRIKQVRANSQEGSKLEIIVRMILSNMKKHDTT